MANTSRGFRYPASGDAPNVHTDLLNLATDADGQYIVVANVGSLPAAAKVGRRAFVTAENGHYYDTGVAWVAEHPRLSASVTSNGQSIATGTGMTQLTMGTEEWDIGNIAAASAITLAAAGDWLVVGDVTWGTGTYPQGMRTDVELRQDAAILRADIGSAPSANGIFTHNIAAIAHTTDANDVATLWARHLDDGSVSTTFQRLRAKYLGP